MVIAQIPASVCIQATAETESLPSSVVVQAVADTETLPASVCVQKTGNTVALTADAWFENEPVYESRGPEWYVDNSVVSNGDGTSWGTAWKNLSNIQWSAVAAGNTIYVSGGPTGSSKTYSEMLTIGKDGNDDNPITIKIKTDDPLHNGRVIIDGGFHTDTGRYDRTNGVILRNNIVIDGSGTSHTEDVTTPFGTVTTNCGICIQKTQNNAVTRSAGYVPGSSADGVVLRNVEIGYIGWDTAHGATPEAYYVDACSGDHGPRWRASFAAFTPIQLKVDGVLGTLKTNELCANENDEWYYDATGKYLWVWSQDGDLNDGAKVITVSPNGVDWTTVTANTFSAQGNVAYSRGISFTPEERCEIDHCYIHHIGNDGINWFGSPIWTYGEGQEEKRSRIHDCVIFRCNDDGVTYRSGIDLYRNYIGKTFNHWIGAGGHPDGVAAQGSYCRVHNNYFWDVHTQLIFFEPTANQVYTAGWIIFNNVLARTLEGTQEDDLWSVESQQLFTMNGQALSVNFIREGIYSSYDHVIAHNTIVDIGHFGQVFSEEGDGPATIQTAYDHNNLVFNCGRLLSGAEGLSLNCDYPTAYCPAPNYPTSDYNFYLRSGSDKGTYRISWGGGCPTSQGTPNVDPYVGVLDHIPVVPGSVDGTFTETVSGMSRSFSDNGSGGLTGAYISGGTIDYNTGTLTFSSVNNNVIDTTVVIKYTFVNVDVWNDALGQGGEHSSNGTDGIQPFTAYTRLATATQNFDLATDVPTVNIATLVPGSLLAWCRPWYQSTIDFDILGRDRNISAPSAGAYQYQAPAPGPGMQGAIGGVQGPLGFAATPAGVCTYRKGGNYF